MGSLCIGCGLCCDGTMYSAVEVDEADAQLRLQAVGFEFLQRGQRRVFALPCTAFRSGCCAIYEQRPARCARYRCGLLRKHEAGEIAEAEARAVIAETIAARDRLRPAVESLTGSTDALSMPELLQRFDDIVSSMDEAARRSHSELLLDVGVWRILLMKNYEPYDTELHKSGPDLAGQETINEP